MHKLEERRDIVVQMALELIGRDLAQVLLARVRAGGVNQRVDSAELGADLIDEPRNLLRGVRPYLPGAST